MNVLSFFGVFDSIRQECAALLYRLHYAGWTHNSFYRRNILMQLGDISDWPITRMNKSKPDRRFRLIDFGRAMDGRTKGKDGEVVWDKDFQKQRAVEEALGAEGAEPCVMIYSVVGRSRDTNSLLEWALSFVFLVSMLSR